MTYDELRIRVAAKRGYTIHDGNGIVQSAMATMKEVDDWINQNITRREEQ